MPESRRPLLPFFLLVLLFVTACSKDSFEGTGADLAANRKTTGASAKDLLTSLNYDRIIFDFVYVDGHRPSQNSVNNLVAFVEERCYKPAGVDYTLTAIPDPGKDKYDIQDILDLEAAYRTAYNNKNDLAVFILVLNGSSVKDRENSAILGTAYRNTSFVIFEETIKGYSVQFLSNDKTVLESTVLHHEFSHLLGLVNLGTTVGSYHEDPVNEHHCEGADCLMNYRTDAGIDLSQVSFGGGIPALDDQCLADLRALGGK